MMTKADIQYHLGNITHEMDEVMVDLNGGDLTETSNGLLNVRLNELQAMLERGKRAIVCAACTPSAQELRACELCLSAIMHHDEWVKFEGSSTKRAHKICHELKKNE